MCYATRVSALSSIAPRRFTTTVDLGDMKDRLADVSAAAGIGPSTWIRELVRRELSAEAPAPATRPVAPPSEPVYRAWLDAPLTAKLDVLTERGGFRTRAAALRAMLEGVNVGQAAGSSLGEAVRALGLSNHRLVAIGRNVNQIAKALHAGDAASVADRLALDEEVQAVRKHLELAATVVAELRPMFKTHREPA